MRVGEKGCHLAIWQRFGKEGQAQLQLVQEEPPLSDEGDVRSEISVIERLSCDVAPAISGYGAPVLTVQPTTRFRCQSREIPQSLWCH